MQRPLAAQSWLLKVSLFSNVVITCSMKRAPVQALEKLPVTPTTSQMKPDQILKQYSEINYMLTLNIEQLLIPLFHSVFSFKLRDFVKGMFLSPSGSLSSVGKGINNNKSFEPVPLKYYAEMLCMNEEFVSLCKVVSCQTVKAKTFSS